MKNWQKFGFAVALVLMLSTVSFADSVVYDNGGYNGNNAWSIAGIYGYTSADDFTLASATSISSINVSLWTNGGALPVSFDWAIQSDAGGAPGATLFSGSANSLNTTFQDLGFGYYNITLNNFPTGINLGAGTFWLSLNNGVSSDGQNIFWSSTDSNSGSGAVTYDANGNLVDNQHGDLSFQLLANDTPEPASLMLLGSGLLGAGSFVRRKLIN